MIVYKYLFYKFYSFSKSIGNVGVANEANAWMNSTIFIWFNLLSFKYIIEVQIKRELFNGSFDFLLAVVVGIFVYLISVRHDSFLQYEKLFLTQKRSKRIIGTMLVIIYCMISVTIFFYLYRLHRAFL